jgi:hypothetical protein
VWGQERGLCVVGTRGLRLAYESGHPIGVEIPAPTTTQRLLALGYVLLASAGEGEAEFPGGLLWLNEWDIWSESFERVGWRIAQRLRGIAKVPSLRDAPAHLFGPDEFIDAQALLLLPMLFQWDAHFVPSSGEFFVYASHEERLLVVASNRVVCDRLFARFEEGDWNPRERPAP